MVSWTINGRQVSSPENDGAYRDNLPPHEGMAHEKYLSTCAPWGHDSAWFAPSLIAFSATAIRVTKRRGPCPLPILLGAVEELISSYENLSSIYQETVI